MCKNKSLQSSFMHTHGAKGIHAQLRKTYRILTTVELSALLVYACHVQCYCIQFSAAVK